MKLAFGQLQMSSALICEQLQLCFTSACHREPSKVNRNGFVIGSSESCTFSDFKIIKMSFDEEEDEIIEEVISFASISIVIIHNNIPQHHLGSSVFVENTFGQFICLPISEQKN